MEKIKIIYFYFGILRNPKELLSVIFHICLHVSTIYRYPHEVGLNFKYSNGINAKTLLQMII